MKSSMIRIALIAGCALVLHPLFASSAKAADAPTCPAEVATGTDFPMTDASKVKWHDSNSLNYKIDYKVVCTWKDATPSKRKEGHVCTYSTFSDCSVEGTPAGTKFYLTDYKPKIKKAK